MKVFRIQVENFRGIKSLDWAINENFHCLIGAGDSTKTTILEAIKLCLNPSWKIDLEDSDFFDCDIEEPVQIRVWVGSRSGDFPADFLREDKFGMFLYGWSAEHGILEEPPASGGFYTICLQFSVSNSLEPKWEVIHPHRGGTTRISSEDRKKIGMVWLGSYVDNDLALGKYTPLGRLFDDELNVPKQILGKIRQEARSSFKLQEAQAGNIFANLMERVVAVTKRMGIASKGELNLALDERFMSEMTKKISLHDGNSPVRLMGLGSRRLSSLAIQNANLDKNAIVLIDEIEYGLEPYRVRHLLRNLRSEKEQGIKDQVFMTTHSSIAITEMKASELFLVKSSEGVTEVLPVSVDLQDILRGSPEAFLGRKIIVCEGKTELGFCRALDQFWQSKGDPPLAHTATTFVDGGGCTSDYDRAKLLVGLNFQVALFRDSDQNPLDPAKCLSEGVKLVQWEGGTAIEERVCTDLPQEGLQDFVDAAANFSSEEVILSQLKSAGLDQNSLSISDWANMTDKEVRQLLGSVAHARSWFKNVEKGEKLGEVVVQHLSQMHGTNVSMQIESLRIWTHGK